MLVVRHPRVGADLHAHLVDTRVLEQREVGVEQPAKTQGSRPTTTTVSTRKASSNRRAAWQVSHQRSARGPGRQQSKAHAVWSFANYMVTLPPAFHLTKVRLKHERKTSAVPGARRDNNRRHHGSSALPLLDSLPIHSKWNQSPAKLPTPPLPSGHMEGPLAHYPSSPLRHGTFPRQHTPPTLMLTLTTLTPLNFLSPRPTPSYPSETRWNHSLATPPASTPGSPRNSNRNLCRMDSDLTLSIAAMLSSNKLLLRIFGAVRCGGCGTLTS